MNSNPPSLRVSNKLKRYHGVGNLPIPMSVFTCVSRVLLGRCGIQRRQTSVELEIVIDHALGGETIAGASVREVGISAAHLTVGIETADGVGETVGIIGFEIESGGAPDLAGAGNIIGDDGGAAE